MLRLGNSSGVTNARNFHSNLIFFSLSYARKQIGVVFLRQSVWYRLALVLQRTVSTIRQPESGGLLKSRPMGN